MMRPDSQKPLRTRRILRFASRCSAAFLLLCIGARSQSTTGIVTGEVSDPDNHPVPSARIVFLNVETGQKRELLTSGDGSYWLNGLQTGRYEARAELGGFRTDIRTGVVVTVAEELVIDFKLKILPVSEEITVASEGSPIETGTSTLSTVVVGQKIRDLPLNGRDLGQLILLQPGIINSRSSVQSANTGRGIRFSAGGARPNQNLFTIDGTTINDALNNTPGSAQGLLLGVETVKEFRVLTANFGAEYGRAAGGVFVGVTKSGSNELHGSLFEFLRNDVFDARNFFDQKKPEFLRNQFGFSAGGPLARNRTFWFASYEGLREHKGVTRVSVVPDENARAGRLPGQPAEAVDPRSKPILDLFPLPNGANLGDGTAAFIGTTNRLSNGNFFTVKLDHNFASDAISVRYLFDDSDQVLPRNFPEFPNFAVNRKQVVTIEERKIVSNTVVNEARFGFNRSTPAEKVPQTTRTLSLIAGQDLGEINVTGLTEIGTDRTNPKGFFLNNVQAADTLFVARGRNNLKLGGSFDRFQYNGSSESRTRGLLRFRSVADLIRFRVRDLEGATPDSDFVRGYRQNLSGVFVQDEFKATSRLTLNGGVRHEWVSTPGEVNGKHANLRSVMDRAVTLGGPYFQPTHHTFAPRAGFALDVLGDGSTVIRSGFGMYFDQPLFHIFRSPAFRSLPFVNRGRLTTVTALPVDPSLFRGVESATEALQFQLRPSYATRYNLTLQRELAGTILSLSYLGSRGVNLVGGVDTNTAYPEIQADGRAFFPEGGRRRNPAFAQVRTILQGFSSSYNALATGVSRHLRRDLQFQIAYTYGKSIDDATGTSRLDYANGQARAFDPYDRRLNRALSDFDNRHTLTANASYQVPLGKNLRGWLRQVANGWQLNTIVVASSGVPFTPLIDGDPDRDGTDENAARPNRLLGASLIPAGGRTPELWFNPQAFGSPAVGFRGTAGRNIVTGPNYRSVDVSLVKHFPLSDARRFEFRVEAFNLLNRANFDLPSKFETAFGGFASPAPWFIFGALLVGMSVTKSGLGQRLAYLVLARTGTTYSRILLGFVLVSFLLTLVVPSGSACIAIKATVALGLVQAFQLLPGSNIARAIFLVLTYSAGLFNKMVIAGTSAILVRGMLQEMAQIEVLWSRWLLAFMPCTVITIFALWRLGLAMFPAERDVSIQGQEFFQRSLRQLGPWTWQEKKVALLLGATVGLWVTDFAHHLSPSVIGIGAGLFAALPRVGVLQSKDVKKLNYGPVLFVASALSLGEVLVNTRAIEVLTVGMFSWMSSVITDASSFSVAAYWTGFVYHLLAGSGIAMMSTSVPPLVNLAQSHGLDPLPVAMIWAFSGGAKIFVYQSSTLILGYSYGYFSSRDLFRFGACMTVIEFVVLFLLVTFYWPWIGLG